jgi:plasmid stability protein
VEVGGGVLVLGGVAAADVSADQAFAQVDPAVADRETRFAAAGGAGWDVVDFIEMATFKGGRHASIIPLPLAVAQQSLLASRLLAFGNMSTLYLRNVPDEVVRRLELLAQRDGTSVSAVAVRELAEVSRRADNPALLGLLPDLGVAAIDIVADLHGDRAGR